MEALSILTNIGSKGLAPMRIIKLHSVYKRLIKAFNSDMRSDPLLDLVKVSTLLPYREVYS